MTTRKIERDPQTGLITRTRHRERRKFIGALGKEYWRDCEIVRTLHRDEAGDITSVTEDVAEVPPDEAELARWSAMFARDRHAPGSYRPVDTGRPNYR